jgi:hypothetical protein
MCVCRREFGGFFELLGISSFFDRFFQMSMEKVYVPGKLGFVSPVVVLRDFLKSALEAEDDLYTFFHNKKRGDPGENEEDTRKSFSTFVERNGQFSEAAEQVISEVE